MKVVATTVGDTVASGEMAATAASREVVATRVAARVLVGVETEEAAGKVGRKEAVALEAAEMALAVTVEVGRVE